MAKSKKKSGTVTKPKATTTQGNDGPSVNLVGGRPDDRNPPKPKAP